jgi:Putative adhesin Stv domain
MTRAFILGHGVRYDGAEPTFVPQGRTISFYAEVDQRVLRVNGLAALSHGAIQPTQTLTGPSQVPNYALRAFGDAAIAEHLASISSASGGRPYFVGKDLEAPCYLCTQPDACPQTYPKHAGTCNGIFTLITEPDILSIACRSVEGAEDKQSTYELGGSLDLHHEMAAEARRLVDWLRTEPKAAIGYWETLTQASQSLLVHMNAELPAAIRAYYRGGGASTPAAVIQARQYLDDYGAGAFYAWVAAMPQNGPQRAMILADQMLGQAFRVGWHEAAPQSVDRATLIGHRVAALAESVAAYTGTEHDDTTGASQAYGALVADVHAYYPDLGVHPDATLHAACADVGSTLSAYGELPGEETLVSLHAAVTALITLAVALGGTGAIGPGGGL